MRHAAWLLLIAIFFYCLEYFFRISPSLVIQPVMHQYHINTYALGTMQSAFYLGYTVMQIPAGYLLSRCRISSLLVVMILLSSLSFIVFCTATHYLLGYAARLCVGVCSALSFLSVLVIAHRFFIHHFSLIAGITIAVGTLSASFLQTVTAWSLGQLTWHTLYIGVAAFSCLFIFPLVLIEEDNAQREKVSALSTLITMRDFFANKALLSNALMASLFYLPTSLFAGLWGLSFLGYRFHMNASVSAFGIVLLFLGWAIGSVVVGYFGNRQTRLTHLPLLFCVLALFNSLCLIYWLQDLRFALMSLFLFGVFSSGQVMVWPIYNRYRGSLHPNLGMALTNMLIMLFATLFHIMAGYLIDLNVTTLSHLNHQQISVYYQKGLVLIPLAFISATVILLYLTRFEVKGERRSGHHATLNSC